MAASRAARVRLIVRAVSVEPVNTTPATRASWHNTAPSTRPDPGRNCKTRSGTPASCSSLTA
jgi:hypothetical protein